MILRIFRCVLCNKLLFKIQFVTNPSKCLNCNRNSFFALETSIKEIYQHKNFKTEFKRINYLDLC